MMLPRCRPPSSPRRPKDMISVATSRLLRALDEVALSSTSSENVVEMEPGEQETKQVANGLNTGPGTVIKSVSNGNPSGSVWPPRRGGSSIIKDLDSNPHAPFPTTSSHGAMKSAASILSPLPLRKLDLSEASDWETFSYNPKNTVQSKKSLETGRSTNHNEDSSVKIVDNNQTNGVPPPIPAPAPPEPQYKPPEEHSRLLKLPRYSYRKFTPIPTRKYVRSVQQAEYLVGALNGPLGFDLEWRVVFRKGAEARPVATVQICDLNMILVIQLTAMEEFPKKLKEILEDQNRPKIGVNILNDGIKLARDYTVRPQNLVELGGLARQADKDYVDRFFRYSVPKLVPEKKESAQTSVRGDVGREPISIEPQVQAKRRKPGYMISLEVITAMYTDLRLWKNSARTSNWEEMPLSETQLEYAANDAHCALMVYNRLMDMAKEAGVQLDATRFTQGVFNSAGMRRTGTGSFSEKEASQKSQVREKRKAQAKLAERDMQPMQTTTVMDINDDEMELVGTSQEVQGSSAGNGSSQSEASQSSGATTQIRHRPQHIRAYNLWHVEQLSMEEMCGALRSKENPLKAATVIGYIVCALRADVSLHFCYENLITLLKMDSYCWFKNKYWAERLRSDVYCNMSRSDSS